MQLVTSKWLNTCLTERIIWWKEKHKKVLIKKKKNTQPVKKNNTTVERREHVQTLSTFIFILKFIRCIHLVPKWNITDLKKKHPHIDTEPLILPYKSVLLYNTVPFL